MSNVFLLRLIKSDSSINPSLACKGFDGLCAYICFPQILQLLCYYFVIYVLAVKGQLAYNTELTTRVFDSRTKYRK